MANPMAEAGKLQHESGSKTPQMGRKCSKNNGDMSKGQGSQQKGYHWKIRNNFSIKVNNDISSI